MRKLNLLMIPSMIKNSLKRLQLHNKNYKKRGNKNNRKIREKDKYLEKLMKHQLHKIKIREFLPC